ncbi:MAG: NADH:flavin oxidoreductase [Armatimonadetes bacterium]|nr:NADH:flavin oxidoreductase [Armatimonadota bacterium]
MADRSYLRLGSFQDIETFQNYLQKLGLEIPCDSLIESGAASPLAQPIRFKDIYIGNRFTVQPMEGWDGAADGKPTENVFRRWRRFGRSGAKLIWGGEAAAVRHDGRANPNQLIIDETTRDEMARLRDALAEEHRKAAGSEDGLLIGLQLTHSGRYSRPDAGGPKPAILYRHPILDRRLGLSADYPLLTDSEIRELIECFHRSARIAREIGFDFVDVKHCHGYLGHEFLSAHTREGDYGGSFENRTRFLREVAEGIRSEAPGLKIGVRLSAFDSVPYRPDPDLSRPGRPGPGVPEPYEQLLPYRWGFGVNPHNPVEPDLIEAERFMSLLRDLDIQLVNLTAGSPYYNPHIQRPALYPPSDGYQPPEDPLAGVARQIQAVRTLKERFPDLLIVGTGYTYLQDFLPHVAQAVVRAGWADSVGLGRMILSYPEMPLDVLQGNPLHHKQVCRTFSDCTTAPRNGLPSGCYPLDGFYKRSEEGERLRKIKAKRA